jgi:hypothetical protein
LPRSCPSVDAGGPPRARSQPRNRACAPPVSRPRRCRSSSASARASARYTASDERASLYSINRARRAGEQGQAQPQRRHRQRGRIGVWGPVGAPLTATSLPVAPARASGALLARSAGKAPSPHAAMMGAATGHSPCMSAARPEVRGRDRGTATVGRRCTGAIPSANPDGVVGLRVPGGTSWSAACAHRWSMNAPCQGASCNVAS